MGGSSCVGLGWIILILHGTQPPCLITILAKVLLEHEGIDELTGRVVATFEHRRHITNLEKNRTAEVLFRYHEASEGVGLVDFIPSIRAHIRTSIGDIASALSEDTTKSLFSAFGQVGGNQGKFQAVKSYIMAYQLNDDTHRRETGEDIDSLRSFREAFDYFFAPKRFIGVRYTLGQTPTVNIKTPFGEHDIDDLSEGEKEIFHLMAHFHRFRSLENIILWDTPEAHLNAALESRLYDALQKIAPRNQFWIATHSLEFISSVPLDNLFTIRWDNAGASIFRAKEPARKTRAKIYQGLGAQVGLQLVSSLVVFVEGKETDSDKRILERLVASSVPSVNFVAGRSSENIFQLGSRANLLFEEATKNGDFLCIVDRDYRSDDELAEIDKDYSGRVFVWHVHEIENLFLKPKIVFETLAFHDKLGNFTTPEEIGQALAETMHTLRSWIAADWLAWEFHQRFKQPHRRVSFPDPEKSLIEYVDRLRQQNDTIPTGVDLQEAFTTKLSEVDKTIQRRHGLQRLPGKQMLKLFLNDFNITIAPEEYLNTATSTVLDKKIIIPEIDRLKNELKRRILQN